MFNKIIYSIALCACFSTLVNAETQPEKVVSIVKVCKPHAWYVEQAGLWKMRIDKNSTDKEAWMNYYMAVRMGHLTEEHGTKSDLPELKAVVEQVAKAIPNSFEANYMIFRVTEPDNFSYLEKAYELAPERPEVHSEMVYHYEIAGDKPQMAEFSKKWLNSGDLSQSLMAWNYNMLMSVEQNGVLLTCGDNDTGPALVLQHAKDVRKDVMLLNVYLLRNKTFRERIFKELKLPAMAENSENLPVNEWISLVCSHFAKNATERPLYLACTMEHEYWTSFSKDLYLTGLAYKYTKERFDNMAVLKRNIDGAFLLDHLRMNFTNEPPEASVYSMNQNYLPAMLTLRQHYIESNDMQNADNLKSIMTGIAKCAGTEKDLQGYMNETPGGDERFVTQVKLDVKQLEMSVRPIKGNLHARQNETTNAEYELFLTDLLKQHDFEKLSLCKVYPVSWVDSVPKDFTSKDPKVLYQNGAPTAPNAPVQNISYEAAQAYCKWLTQVCNTNAKKKYKKVVFRLPTAQEWETAARAKGSTDANYPWGGPLPNNSVGCYLANFNAHTVPAPSYKGKSKTPCNENCAIDGTLFPTDVYSYWPNDFELYNTVGNVAEMTNEKGIAKGGSWYHKPEDSTIKSVQHYAGPTPWLGFRVFMEVIEQ